MAVNGFQLFQISIVKTQIFQDVLYILLTHKQPKHNLRTTYFTIIMTSGFYDAVDLVRRSSVLICKTVFAIFVCTNGLKRNKKHVFCLLPNSMWRGLLLDPLLSLFGHSGGRHFKLLLDEVRVVITWLQSSICGVCMCMNESVTWFLSENISWDVCLHCAATTAALTDLVFMPSQTLSSWMYWWY